MRIDSTSFKSPSAHLSRQALSNAQFLEASMGSFASKHPRFSGTEAKDTGILEKVVTMAKDYGPYAIIGGFFSAVGLAGYTFADNYFDWLQDSNFPIKKWPNTANAILEQHHHGAEHADTGIHAGHTHSEAGQPCSDANCKTDHSRPPGLMSSFGDPEAPTITDRTQNDQIRRLEEAVKTLETQSAQP